MGWRNCQTSVVLAGQINSRWPKRDKSSDGTIGDAAHATRSSDHNPWVLVNGQGVVRARDVDKDGVDIGWMFEELRKLGAQGDPRLAGGGYLIWNRRITSPDFTKWVPYNGSNPHDKHGHISFTRSRSGFDSTAPYKFLGGPGTGGGGIIVPPPATGALLDGDRMAREGERGSDVAWIQQRLNIQGHSVNVDAYFGPQTTAAVKNLQRFFKVTADGVVGPKTRALLELNPPPRPAARPVLKLGSKGDGVKILQERLSVRYPSYRHEHGVLKIDGDFGKTTEAWVKELQGRVGLKADGIVGPATFKAIGL